MRHAAGVPTWSSPSIPAPPSRLARAVPRPAGKLATRSEIPRTLGETKRDKTRQNETPNLTSASPPILRKSQEKYPRVAPFWRQPKSLKRDSGANDWARRFRPSFGRRLPPHNRLGRAEVPAARRHDRGRCSWMAGMLGGHDGCEGGGGLREKTRRSGAKASRSEQNRANPSRREPIRAPGSANAQERAGTSFE